jgi:DNA-binding transcriptional LysR family regulator
MAGYDWDDLKIFLAVARTGRLSSAAALIAADHATVSRKIGALENCLKVKLFDRKPSGCTPTVHGERLLASAEAMERLAMFAQSEIGEADLSLSGTVRVGAPEGFGSYFLAPHLGALKTQHPDLFIELVAIPKVISLSKREADIVVTLDQPEDGRLFARRLTNYQLGLYASAGYLRTAPPVRARDDLLERSIIGYIDDLLYSSELNHLREIDDRIVPNLTSSNLTAQLKATVAGAGICALPSFIAVSEPQLIRVLPKIKLMKSYWLVTHSDLRQLARIKAVTEFIVARVREYQPLFLGPEIQHRAQPDVAASQVELL